MVEWETKVLSFDERRRESFKTAWRYHGPEFLLFAIAVISYVLFIRHIKPGLPKTIFWYFSFVYPFVVALRILHSGFTGRLDKDATFWKKNSKFNKKKN